MVSEKILTQMFYRVLAMPSSKKIILDQNLWGTGLVDTLHAVNINKVYNISYLGLDPSATTEDAVIHKKLVKLGKKTPNSGFLFITKNAKHFKSPTHYDVLWVPDKLNLKNFVEALKSWLSLTPLRATNTVYQANATRSKYSQAYEFTALRL